MAQALPTESGERRDAALLLQCPTERLLNKFVVPHIIHEWRVFGISLGVSANAVETIYREEKDSRYACIKMFTQWLRDGARQQGGGCTWKELLEAVSDSSGPGVSNEIERKLTEHLALVQVQQQEKQASSVHSRIEQFEKNAEEKPTVRPMQRGTRKTVLATPHQAESHHLRCEQDDRRERVDEPLQSFPLMAPANEMAFEELDVDDLYHVLVKELGIEIATVIRDQDVSGQDFLDLTEANITNYFSDLKLGQAKKVLRLIKAKTCSAAKTDSDPDVKTHAERYDKMMEEVHKVDVRPAMLMKSQSKILEKGPPDIYQLPLVAIWDAKMENITKYAVGKSLPARSCGQEFIVMVVGATGAGKTTLINGMANYILGVEWKDDFRFKLADDGKGSQAQSKTKGITAYTIYKQDGSPFPHTLTIIDTPGFGDNEGPESDKYLVKLVRVFFSMGGVKGIDYIHAIGFVTSASLPRLTHTQRYIFDSILSIFGKDIRDNIALMLTFADMRKPSVLSAVKEADIPFCKSFKFNNYALFPDHQDESFAEDELYWKLGMKNFEEFTKHLVTMQARSLTLTKEVLGKRQHLETLMLGLQVQMKFMAEKIDVLKQEEQVMQDSEAKIAANENFTYTVMVQKIWKHDIAGTGRYVMQCLKCNFTCHDYCTVEKNAYKCSVMEDGSCTVCPGRCKWDTHVSNSFWFEVVEEPEEREDTELKDRYVEATKTRSRVQLMVDKIEAEIAHMYATATSLIGDAQQVLKRLDEIALRPNPRSQFEYIDLLIQSEIDVGKVGYQKRVACLKKIRKQAKLLIVVQDGAFEHEELKEAGEIASRKSVSQPTP